ncbi:MAG: LptF/LptG family permease [Phycisphaerales bacterium]
MNRLDRHILFRFLTNFVLLFVIMFLFAAAIDLVLALDEFVEAADAAVGENASFGARTAKLLALALDFQAPRFFQFYAFLHGMLAVGAMAFTLARMHKHRELVAMLAAGISMKRIAMPFVVGMFVLGLAQLVNQEIFLPRVAPLLVRGHDQIGQQTLGAFPVDFTRDSRGTLLQAASFDPSAQRMDGVTILERDDAGRTRRRITAATAEWRAAADGTDSGWVLQDGASVELDVRAGSDAVAPSVQMSRGTVDFVPTDLSPRVLVIRRHGSFASMLSLPQLREILAAPAAVDRPSLIASLERYAFSRFSSVIVNVLLMWLALPAFLLRGPGNMMKQSLICAAITLPAVIGSAIFMLVEIGPIPAALSVFLPALVLLLVVIGQWMLMVRS